MDSVGNESCDVLNNDDILKDLNDESNINPIVNQGLDKKRLEH